MDAYQHLVTIHDDKYFTFHPDTAGLIDFITDQNHFDIYHTIIHQHSLRNVPVINEEFGYEHTPDDVNGGAWGWTHTPMEVLERAYEVVMAGGYPTHYYTNHAWDIIKWDEMPACAVSYKAMKEFFIEAGWTDFQPRPELSRQWSGRCLMRKDMKAMILYAYQGRTSLISDWVSSEWSGFWMNIWTGEKRSVTLRLEKGGSGDLHAPFDKESAVGYFEPSTYSK